jgi:NAD(P)-dependent dehydrogenase (short-subunit alcohol dehydrogenase family)
MGFKDKVVVITGAAAGVGRAVAHRFAKDGARIALIARDMPALAATREEVEQLGGEGLCAPADVADAEQLFDAAARIERQLGPIDVWVNDAMVTVFSPIWEMSPEEFRRVTEVTYLGQVHGTMAALKSMRPRRRGVIVQVGSALAYRGIPLQSAYCGAKYAIRGFTDAVRTELKHERSHIHLSMVELPAVNTPQFDWARVHIDKRPRPMGEVFTPQTAARAVHTAAALPWREYWVGRETLLTILGNMILPSFMDSYLESAFAGQKTPAPVSPDRRDNLFEPVTDLHRTSGSFGGEARGDAIIVPGPLVRLGAVMAGAAAFLAAGYLGGRLRRGPRRLSDSGE